MAKRTKKEQKAFDRELATIINLAFMNPQKYKERMIDLGKRVARCPKCGEKVKSDEDALCVNCAR